jgi:hypothetical protein
MNSATTISFPSLRAPSLPVILTLNEVKGKNLNEVATPRFLGTRNDVEIASALCASQ